MKYLFPVLTFIVGFALAVIVFWCPQSVQKSPSFKKPPKPPLQPSVPVVPRSEVLVLKQGSFGLPLGKYLTIGGTITDRKPPRLLVDTVNERKLGSPVPMWIGRSRPSTRGEGLISALPKGQRCVVRGFESGAMIGVPTEVEKAEEGVVVSASGWYFSNYFVVTSVVEPKGLKLENKVAKLIDSLPNADYLPQRYRPPEGVDPDNPEGPLPASLKGPVEEYHKNIAELQGRFKKLKTFLKQGDSVFDYPGLLAKGTVRYDVTSGSYHLRLGVYDEIKPSGGQGAFAPYRVTVGGWGTITSIWDCVSWGVPVSGLQAGCSAKKTNFEAGRQIELSLHLRNAGKKPLELYGGLGSINRWYIIFRPKRGGVPRWARYNEKPADYGNIVLAKGQSYTKSFTIGAPGHGWTFEHAHRPSADVKRAVPVKHLPPGKYIVKATYQWSEAAGSKLLWYGRVVTGSMEIDIESK